MGLVQDLFVKVLELAAIIRIGSAVLEYFSQQIVPLLQLGECTNQHELSPLIHPL